MNLRNIYVMCKNNYSVMGSSGEGPIAYVFTPLC